MIEDNPMSEEDRNFLRNVASLFDKAIPTKNRDGMMAVIVPNGDPEKIAEKLKRISAFGDSGTEIQRVVV